MLNRNAAVASLPVDQPAAPLSVAICTRDRPLLVARALRSLMRQSVEPSELFVIDIAPTDTATANLVRSRFPRVHYVVEPAGGLNAARNRALREATQPVVAFLDDDAIADPSWAATFLSVFDAEPGVGLCAGRVEAFSTRFPGERVFEANGGFSRGLRSIRLPETTPTRVGLRAPLIARAASVACGCSFAIRRDLAVALSGFDTALDVGPRLPSGGDHDMLWRVLSAGHDVLYEPTALALHEHRRELEDSYEEIVGHQRALITWLTKVVGESRGPHLLSALSFLAWRLLKPSLRLLRRAVGRDPLPLRVLWSMWYTSGRTLAVYPHAKRTAARRRRDAL